MGKAMLPPAGAGHIIVTWGRAREAPLPQTNPLLTTSAKQSSFICTEELRRVQSRLDQALLRDHSSSDYPRVRAGATRRDTGRGRCGARALHEVRVQNPY